MVFCTAAVGAAGDPGPYTADAKTIYYSGVPIYSLSAKALETVFLGPITFEPRVVYIVSDVNLALAFSGKTLVDKKTVSSGATLTSWPMRIVTVAALRVKEGIILYNIYGEARILKADFSVQRLRKLDTKPDVDGIPWECIGNRILTGRQRIDCSKRVRGDSFIIIDCDSLEIVGKGASDPVVSPRAKP